MTAPLAYVGFQKYLMARAETTFGTLGSGAYSYLPFTEYNVMVKPKTRQAAIFTGLYERLHSSLDSATIQGNFATNNLAFVQNSLSNMQMLWNWAMTRTGGFNLPSYSLELAENGVENKRHLGCRLNGITLQGSIDAGAITASTDIMGINEIGGITLQTPSNSQYLICEYLFKDTTLEVKQGSTSASVTDATNIKSFSIQVQNNISPIMENAYFPTDLPAGQRAVTCQITFLKRNAVYDAIVRSPTQTPFFLVLTIKGRHKGSGGSGTSFVTTQLEMPLCMLSNYSTAAGLNDAAVGTVDFIVLKPATALDELIVSSVNTVS